MLIYGNGFDVRVSAALHQLADGSAGFGHQCQTGMPQFVEIHTLQVRVANGFDRADERTAQRLAANDTVRAGSGKHQGGRLVVHIDLQMPLDNRH